MSVVQLPAGTEVYGEAEGEAGYRDTQAMGLAYANTINPTNWFLLPYATYTFGDDCYLAGSDRSMLQYELVLWNYGGGSGKSCTVSLWSGTTAGGPTAAIGGTSRTVTLATASTVQTFTQTFSGVTLPDLVFAAFDTNNDNIGLPYAGPVELGSSENLFWVRTESTGVWAKYAGGSDPVFAYNTWFRIWVNTAAVCGNGIREGTEECDGTDNANCLGTACKSDCTCSCVVTCPGGAHVENEACGESVNGSCLEAEVITCGQPVCGTSYSTTATRDTDWYKITTTGDTRYDMTVTAEFGAIVGLIEYNPGFEGSGNCNETTGYIEPYMTAGPCEEKTLNIPCMPGGIYFFFVSKPWEDWPCSNPYGEIDYVVTVDCVPCYAFCPANTLFGQPVAGTDDSWSAGTSDLEVGYIRYEKFWDLYGDIEDLHWWGLTLSFTTGWEACTESPMTFEIKFYQDASGQPGAQVGSTYTVTLTPVATGDLYGTYPLYYFSTNLSPIIPAGLYAGHVSIQAVSPAGGCYFLWMSSTGQDLQSLFYDGTTWTTEAFDLSLCITGTAIDPLGACCNMTGPEPFCVDPLPLSTCNQPGYRFQAGVTCDDMVPPCGWGTCCLPGVERECVYLEAEVDCINLQGVWHDAAEGLMCEPINPCPCTFECPPDSVAELEACGADTNGGCNDDPTYPFETFLCNTTVCGSSTCDGTNRDTDWFEIDVPVGEFSFLVVAEYPVLIFVMDPVSGDCVDYEQLASADSAQTCAEVEIAGTINEAGPLWLWVGPRDWDTIVTCGENDRYLATVTCGGQAQECGNGIREGTEECDGTDAGNCATGLCKPDCTCEVCPPNAVFVAYPPDGITDATQAHPISALTPCAGIGQPGGWVPITINLGVSGATDLSCWSLCETGFSPACAANSITSVVEGPAGVYTINLAHGISAYDVGAPAPAVGVGHATTIQYNGGSFVKYYKHPGNVDGSSFTNAQDITQLIQRLNIALGGGSVLLWETDINQSGSITVADLTALINLLNGATQYDIWFGTPKPTGVGCP